MSSGHRRGKEQDGGSKATEKWRAQRKPLFSHGSAPAGQRVPSGHVSRTPTRASHRAAGPSCGPGSPPAAPPRSYGSPHGCLDAASTAAPRASTPGTSSLGAQAPWRLAGRDDPAPLGHTSFLRESLLHTRGQKDGTPTP